jgi:methyl-accepting chemotaxis protein
MKRKFIVFSSVLFLLIFVLGSIAFFILMRQLLHDNSGYELMKAVELERLRLEVSVNSEIAIILKMANSPLIRRYFSNPDDPELRELAFEEIWAYSHALKEKSILWLNNYDKIFYTTEYTPYIVDPENPDNYWYNITLYETEAFNFDISHNPDLNTTKLWIKAPVFDSEKTPVGMVGTGINLSSFINAIYMNYSRPAELFFFNTAGQITGARNIDLVANKVSIYEELGDTGLEILAKMKDLKNGEIKYFHLVNEYGVVVIGAIPSLNWYITAIHRFTYREAMQTGMTVLFAIMMAVIFSIFAASNIFVAKLLEPLYLIVKEISQISSDWDLKRKNETYTKNEIDALGEFLNMTVIDQLTGISNRRFFDGSMKKIIRSLSRTGGKLSLLMIDIDFFKNYNDTYGHDMGDKCLKEVAAILSRSIIREDDFVARYGGEEFVVVLPNTKESGALLLAERVLKNIRNYSIPHTNSDAASFVTVSIGVTTGIVKYSQNASDFVKHADAGLYKSKQNGRNQYTFEIFDESKQSVSL